MSKKVSFQGVEGAYSHLAVQEFFPDAEAIPCKTFELALTAAESGNVDYACLLYTSPSPRDAHESRMPSSA